MPTNYNTTTNWNGTTVSGSGWYLRFLNGVFTYTRDNIPRQIPPTDEELLQFLAEGDDD